MIKKPAGCSGCVLADKGKGYVPDKISKKHKIVFYGEAPGKREIEHGEPFSGDSGFVLRQWLVRAVPDMQIAMEKSEVSLCSTLRCLPPDNGQGKAYPTGEERIQAEAHCRQYDPKLDGVHTVVLFGEAAQRLFFKTELDLEDATSRMLKHDLKGMVGRIGRTYKQKDALYVFAPHPTYVLKQPAFVIHGQRALQIACDTEKIVDVAYVEWSSALAELF